MAPSGPIGTLNRVDEGDGLSIRLFGPFELWSDGHPARLRSRAAEWLLALLILRKDTSVEREWLAATLWPDSRPDQASYNLRRNLSDIRAALGSQSERVQSSSTRHLRFCASAHECDLLAFDSAIRSGDPSELAKAVELYRGDLLEGCAEEWIQQERRVRELTYLNALETLATVAMTENRPAKAIEWTTRLLADDPARESAVCRQMECHAAQNDLAAVTRTYRRFCTYLKKELKSDPAEDTTALYRDLLRSRGPLPRSAGTARPSNHLPAPLTPLIGRDNEVGEVRTALRTARLITLAGPGGVGKTRLAIAVARMVERESPRNIWFVDLAPVRDHRGVAGAVATALGLPDNTSLPTGEAIKLFLAGKEALLVLDNCEHVIEGSAGLCEQALFGSPDLRVLATSRQSLGVPGERVYRVPSLASPPGLLLHAESALPQFVLGFPAVELFAEAAAQVQPLFRVEPANARLLAEVCNRLDGIPLALELAAAQMQVMSLAELASRLGERFRILNRGRTNALPRQRTLEATLDWSYSLLTSAEQRLFRRLAAFRAGWTLDAAESVCSDEECPRPEVLGGLAGLVDKSLVACDMSGRYSLLETVRQYAENLLDGSGERADVLTRHRDYYLSWAEEAETELQGPEQGEWMARLECDHDNLRTSLRACIEEAARPCGYDGQTGPLVGPAEAALRLTRALFRFWWTRGHISEARVWHAAVLKTDPAMVSAKVRADVLIGAALLADFQADHGVAVAYTRESLSIYRAIGDRRGISQSLSSLASLAGIQGDYATFKAYHQESLALYEELGDQQGIADAFENMGMMERERGEYAAAQAFDEEALALRRQIGDSTAIAKSPHNLGLIARAQGNSPGARSRFEESLCIRRQVGDRAGIADSTTGLAMVVTDEGDYALAQSLHLEALAHFREIGDSLGVAWLLPDLAYVTHCQGDYCSARGYVRESLQHFSATGNRLGLSYALETLALLLSMEACTIDPAPVQQFQCCVSLWGAAEMVRQEIGGAVFLGERRERDQYIGICRSALGENAFQDAWEAGRRMSVNDAIGYASSGS